MKYMYSICPKIPYTKVSDKLTYENGADPDQTAPDTVCHATKYFKTQLPKKSIKFWTIYHICICMHKNELQHAKHILLHYHM